MGKNKIIYHKQLEEEVEDEEDDHDEGAEEEQDDDVWSCNDQVDNDFAQFDQNNKESEHDYQQHQASY